MLSSLLPPKRPTRAVKIVVARPFLSSASTKSDVRRFSTTASTEPPVRLMSRFTPNAGRSSPTRGRTAVMSSSSCLGRFSSSALSIGAVHSLPPVIPVSAPGTGLASSYTMLYHERRLIRRASRASASVNTPYTSTLRRPFTLITPF